MCLLIIKNVNMFPSQFWSSQAKGTRQHFPLIKHSKLSTVHPSQTDIMITGCILFNGCLRIEKTLAAPVCFKEYEPSFSLMDRLSQIPYPHWESFRCAREDFGQHWDSTTIIRTIFWLKNTEWKKMLCHCRETLIKAIPTRYCIHQTWFLGCIFLSGQCMKSCEVLLKMYNIF